MDQAAIVAAAAERAKAREAVLEEKKRARQEKEREARDGEREKDRQGVMRGGNAFVAVQWSVREEGGEEKRAGRQE